MSIDRLLRQIPWPDTLSTSTSFCPSNPQSTSARLIKQDLFLLFPIPVYPLTLQSDALYGCTSAMLTGILIHSRAHPSLVPPLLPNPHRSAVIDTRNV
jgi:hypothetical protein